MYKRYLAIILTVLGMADAYAQGRFTATWVVDGAKEKYENRSHTTLEAMEQGSSVIYATNGVDLILTKLRMNKTSGTVVDEDRRLTGRNSALLADGGSKVLMEQCDLTTHTTQSDGITSNGDGTRVIVQEGTLTINRMGSAAVNAIHGGQVVVQETEVNTAGNQSPAFIALDGGQIDVTGAFGNTYGQASPLFHSDGKIVATNCRMGAARWTIGNVEDGEMTLVKNEVKSGGISGFLLYSTKEADVESSLSLQDNKISVGEGPVFLVTNNNNAHIALKGNKINCKSDDLLQVRADDWGTKGRNGGHAHLWVDKQSLSGNIFVDSISSLEVGLRKGAKLNGQINDKENRCARVSVHIGTGSSWTSKGESYLTSITFEQPLAKGLKQLKGKHTIYYDPSDPANAPLEGKEHKTGGGVLRPIK
ncbi:MAG: hypothetical protein IK038_10695 [Bacteroidaceae bacterium]|nr:hypothetical protein [Bacteroidaceae bacterium]